MPLVAIVITRTTAARLLQLPQRPTQGINLPFVGVLLPLGEFRQFQDLLHLIEDFLEGLDDVGNLFDGLGDGRAFPFRLRLALADHAIHPRRHGFQQRRWLRQSGGQGRGGRFDQCLNGLGFDWRGLWGYDGLWAWRWGGNRWGRRNRWWPWPASASASTATTAMAARSGGRFWCFTVRHVPKQCGQGGEMKREFGNMAGETQKTKYPSNQSETHLAPHFGYLGI